MNRIDKQKGTQKGMNKKPSLIFFMSLLVVLMLSITKAQIYLGTTEGYIFYSNGTPASNALVTVSVRNCQAPNEYCVRQTYSQSNGYYVLANLALDPYEWVDVTAEKGNWFGQDSDQADSYGAAFVNVTMCLAPSKPVLQQINDFHPTNKTYSVVFNWTSGIDQNNLSTYDMFYLDGNWESPVNAPIIRINLDFGQHTWGIVTCNNACCSNAATDTFTIINNPPPTPNLIDQGNTNNNTVILKWYNVTDPDGDPVFYDFMIDSGLRENVTSPQQVEGLSYGYHEWKVRACDLWQCSEWATDSFYVQNQPCPKPNLTEIDNICNAANINFEWQSASQDAEGQQCHDEFWLNGIVIDNNATSPKTLSFTQTQVVEWAVRSCDVGGACSEWAADSFIYCLCESQPSAGGGGGGISKARRCEIKEVKAVKGYYLYAIIPNKIYQGDEFKIEINFLPLEDYGNVSLMIENNYPEYFSIQKNKITLGDIAKGKEIKLPIDFVSSKDTPKGTYDFYIRLNSNDLRIFYKKITIDVEEIPTIAKLIPIEKRVYNYLCCVWLLLLILIIIITIIIIIIYKIYKNLKKRKIKNIR